MSKSFAVCLVSVINLHFEEQHLFDNDCVIPGLPIFRISATVVPLHITCIIGHRLGMFPGQVYVGVSLVL